MLPGIAGQSFTFQYFVLKCNRAWDNVEAGVTGGLLSYCIVLFKAWNVLALLRAFLARFSPHHCMKHGLS